MSRQSGEHRSRMSEKVKNKRFHIGCQSWQYDDWVTKAGGETVFYPRGTKSPEMLSEYARVFDTIEVDSTAYGTPARSTIMGWLESTPENFQFSLKVPRAITHEFSLGPHSLNIFDEFTDAAQEFGERLGAVLIQLPAAFEATKENGQNVRDFLSRLPLNIRFAIEFRNPGWFVEWTFDELNERNVALALVAGKWIPEEAVFAAFEKTRTRLGYLRFMGIRDLPSFERVHRERTAELESWANMITSSLVADNVYIYVDNYFEGQAPATANKLKQMLDQAVVDPASLEPQASLF